MNEMPPDPTVLRWLYENLWLPALGLSVTAFGVSSKYLLGAIFARIKAVEIKSETMVPRLEFQRENDRNVRGIHELRGDLSTSLNTLHAKIDQNHRDVMRMLVKRTE